MAENPAVLRVVALLLAICLPSVPSLAGTPENNSEQRTLEMLVEGQRRLDRLAWQHRIWPTVNTSPRPSFDSAVPPEASRARVVEILRLKSALRMVWNRPLELGELQAELGRIHRRTKDPVRLRQRFDELANDPWLIQSLIVEPILAARRVRQLYETDSALHAELRRKLERQLRSVDQPFAGARFELVRREQVDDDIWRESSTPLEVIEPNLLRQTGKDGWVLEESDGRFKVRLAAESSAGLTISWFAIWPKTSFDTWWCEHQTEFEPTVDRPESVIDFTPGLPETTCSPGTWDFMASNSPDSRYSMSSVWTGSELFVWGGTNGYDYFKGGGRYDPATDSWKQISHGGGAPTPRIGATAVWTGTEVIVWGGREEGFPTTGLDSGARYDPVLDRWTPTATGGDAPSGRYRHVAVWSGTEMIIWGGRSSSTGAVRTGARYKPLTNSWTPTAIDSNTPSARTRPSSAWIGTGMFIWGGSAAGVYDQVGAIYRPATDSWEAIPSIGAPAGRDASVTVWTGSEVLIWGGYDATSERGDGGRYAPNSASWAPITNVGAPTSRVFHTGAWSGSRLFIWGGTNIDGTVMFGDGGLYDPVADAWTSVLGDAAVLGARTGSAIVWTGTEFLIWGGDGEGTGPVLGARGARFDPVTGTWQAMGGRGVSPGRRSDFVHDWNGAELLVWGGADGTPSGTTIYDDGSRYDPSTDSWTPLPATGVLAPRSSHTSVWTGNHWIVWGGRAEGSNFYGDGASFDPAQGTWTAIPVTQDAPGPRVLHTATWTGNSMIVWGGVANSVAFNNGAAFSPITNTWTPIPIDSQTPSARYDHSATWTGTRLVVFGGRAADPIDQPDPIAAQFDPVLNVWISVAPPPGPDGNRYEHAAAWTGSRVLIWGGRSVSRAEPTDQGLAYDPALEVWTVLPKDSNTPAPRQSMQSAWDGESLIVWGGHKLSALFGDGSRYIDGLGAWNKITGDVGVPEARGGATDDFDGSRFYVWGGYRFNTAIGQGSAYCRCTGQTYYRDVDGDGFGSSTHFQAACSTPSGHVSTRGDCNDQDASIHPGAIEWCDGLDNDCDGTNDENSIPRGVSGVVVEQEASQTRVSWAPLALADTYDVVLGDLSSLLFVAGDYSAASLSCLADNQVTLSVIDPTSVAAGQSALYLVRANGCGSGGTYDDPNDSQVISRDPGISANSGACP